MNPIKISPWGPLRQDEENHMYIIYEDTGDLFKKVRELAMEIRRIAEKASLHGGDHRDNQKGDQEGDQEKEVNNYRMDPVKYEALYLLADDLETLSRGEVKSLTGKYGKKFTSYHSQLKPAGVKSQINSQTGGLITPPTAMDAVRTICHEIYRDILNWYLQGEVMKGPEKDLRKVAAELLSLSGFRR